MKKIILLLTLVFSSFVHAQDDLAPPPPPISSMQLIKSITPNIGSTGTPVTIVTNDNTINSAKFGVGTTEETITKIGDGNLSNTFNTPFKPDLGTHEVILNYDEISSLSLSPNSVISFVEFYVQSGIPTQLENFNITASLSGYSTSIFESGTSFGIVFKKTSYTPTIENGKIRIVLDSPIVLDNDYTYTDFQLTFNYDNNVGSSPENALSIESSDIYGGTRPNVGLGIFTYSGGVSATEISSANVSTYIVNAPTSASTGRILIEGYGAYAISKDIFTYVSIPVTKLKTSFCNTTLAGVSSTIQANAVTGAQAYRFEVTHGATVRTIDSNTNGFRLTDLSGGATNSTTYTIRVAIKMYNTWGNYGDACNVTTPAQTTRLSSKSCNTTLLAITNLIYANAVDSAQEYKFEVTHNSVSREFTSSNNYFRLTDLSGGVLYGTTYTVRVSVKINNVWGPWGTTCTVTTPMSLSKVKSSQCNTILPYLNTLIQADAISGAEMYRFEVTQGGSTRTYDSATNGFRLTQLSGGAAYSTLYSVTVSVKYGGTWGSYGTACNITTPNASAKEALSEEVTQTVLYPNPYHESFKIAFSGEEETKVQVFIYDASGRLVSQKETTSESLKTDELGQGFSTGVYTIQIQQGERVEILRVVKH